MRTLTKFVAAAAAAVSITAIASPSQAALVDFASFIQNSVGTDVLFTNTGGGTATMTTTVSAAGGAGISPSIFTYSLAEPLLNALGGLKASFNLNASIVPSTVALQLGGGSFLQNGFDGSFSYTYTGPNFTFGANTYSAGANLLKGVFHNGQIFGSGRTGQGGDDTTLGGTVFYTSDLLNFGATVERAFSISLNSVAPGFGAAGCPAGGAFGNCTSALNTFRASTAGSFSSDPLPTYLPEPGTWGLMLVGFGGMGAMLRSRRRAAAVTA